MLSDRPRRIFLLLFAIWCASLPLRPLLDPDEGRYAEIPRAMWASGDWVTPRLNGLEYFEKPPLQYWATAAAYSLLGPSQGASRIWAVVLAFLCIPLVYGFARRCESLRSSALTAALLLAANPLFAALGQVNLLDQSFTFFLCAALFAFLLAQSGAKSLPDERRWMLLCWAALALAVLSKGPVALILAGGAVMLYVAVMRDLTVLRRMHVLIGLPLFLAITAPWFALVQLRNPTFAEFFFVHENLARFLTTVHHREGPVWYFLPFLALGLSPWLWSLRSTATAAFDSRVQRAGFNVTIFLSLWCLLVLVFFSVSQSKLPPYILPIMPALAVLLAPIVAADGRAAPRAAWVLGGFFVFLAAGLLVFDWQRDGVLNAALGAWCLVAAGAGLGVILALRSRRELDGLRPPNPWLPHALAATLGVQALIMGYASLAPVRSARGLVADIAPYVQSRTRVYSVGQYRHSASFYLGRALRVVDFSGELEFGIANNPGSALPDVAAFAAEWRGSTDAVAIFAPGAVAEFDRLGLPGRRIAADGRSVAVSRR